MWPEDEGGEGVCLHRRTSRLRTTALHIYALPSCTEKRKWGQEDVALDG